MYVYTCIMCIASSSRKERLRSLLRARSTSARRSVSYTCVCVTDIIIIIMIMIILVLLLYTCVRVCIHRCVSAAAAAAAAAAIIVTTTAARYLPVPKEQTTHTTHSHKQHIIFHFPHNGV